MLLRVYLGIGAVLGVAYFVTPDSPLRTGLWVTIALSSAIAIFVGVRRHRPAAPVPWILMALGLISYTIGEFFFYYPQLAEGKEATVPSIADPFYLVLYPCLAGALIVFVRRQSPGGDRPAVLDGMIITIGVALLTWVFLIQPYVNDRSIGFAERITSIAYPLGDILVLAVLARIGTGRSSRGASFRLLGFGLLALLFADALYTVETLNGVFVAGGVLDVGWTLFYLAVGCSALHPAMVELDRATPIVSDRITRGRFAMVLAVAALLVPLVITIRSARLGDLPVYLGVIFVLFCLVLARMAGLVQVIRDLHHQRAEGRFQRLTEQVTDVLTVGDRNAIIQYVTPSIERLLGHPATDVVGQSIVDLIHPDDAERVGALLATSTSGAQIGPVECRLRHADGTWVTTETVGRVVDDDDLRGYLLTTRDITERKALEDQLTHQAFHDELTGLANRALLADRVHHALERRGTPYRHLAVLVVDLDDFKTINDSLGRAIGDQLLCAVADRLRTCLRSADTAARLGGDEFAMLLEHLDDPAEAARIAERVLATMRQPLAIGGREIQPRASVGIALADPDRLPDADELLRNADVAMHMAKRQGRNRFAYFAPAMQAGLLEKLDLADALRGAIERHELKVYYQPFVDLVDGRIIGAEALVRWPHPEKGLVPPDQFIPLAEETGLVLPLGYEVLNVACRQAARWQRDGFKRLSVNLSPRQLQDPSLVLYVQQALALSGLPPEALTLEMTESLLSEDAEVATHRLAELKALGVWLAVDDFGTGYSSLSRLHDFPIDILKIPKPFVDGVARGTEHSALARAILDLAGALGLQVVAEGIEEAEQAQELRRLGCRIGQGFHFARAVPAGEFDMLLAKGAFGMVEAPS